MDDRLDGGRGASRRAFLRAGLLGRPGFAADGGTIHSTIGHVLHASCDAATGKPLDNQMTPEDEVACYYFGRAVAWLYDPFDHQFKGADPTGREEFLRRGGEYLGHALKPFWNSAFAATPDGRQVLVEFAAAIRYNPALLISLKVWDADRGRVEREFTPSAWPLRLCHLCRRLDQIEAAARRLFVRADAAPPAESGYDGVWFGRVMAVVSRLEPWWGVADHFALLTLLGRPTAAGGLAPAALAPDGRLAMAVRGSGVQVWDIATGRAGPRLPSGRADAFAFDAAGVTLLTAARGTLARFDAATGRQLWTATGFHGDVRSIAFSPDGRLALVVGQSRGVWLWDAGAGRLIGRVGGAGAVPTDAAFLGGGQVVTLTPDGDKAAAVQVWRLAGR